MTGVTPLPGILLVYFAVPVRPPEANVDLAISVLLTLIGVSLVATVIIREARRLSSGDNQHITVVHLVALVEVAMVTFALAYYTMAIHSQEMDGIHTRLDALYFSATTTTTVGFGDITPVGQLARALTTVQVSFDVLFVAALAGLIGRTLRGR